MKHCLFKVLVSLLVAAVAMPLPASAVRVKDITTVSGMRSNQLLGYGLMVGLKNTGDRSHKTPFTAQTLVSMLKRLGTTIDIRQLTGKNIGVSQTRHLRDVRVENVAAVMVTAELPPFSKPGQKINISVSSLGDAKSLEGGMLLLTPLKAANGKVYAVAQGKLPERIAKGRGRKALKHIPTTGFIPNGALVEQGVAVDFANKTQFQILLNSPDFTTATTIVDAVNQQFGKGTAAGLDAGTVEISLPDKFSGNPFGFLAQVESINVKKDAPAKVVLDETMGTVVIGENVELNSVAISFSGMTISVRKAAFGRTEPTASVKGKLNVVEANSNLKELVDALNALGVSPQDLVGIFRALRASGSLNAQLEIL